MKKETVTINTTKVTFYSTNPTKKPVILVHGNSLSSKIFIKQLEDNRLSENYNLIALDLPGYGDSGNSENPEKDYSEVFKSFLQEFYKTLNIKEAVFVGHSLGGNILLQTFDTLPNPKALVLIGVPPLAKPFEPDCYLPHPATQHFFQENLTDDIIQLIASSLLKPKSKVPEFLIKIIKRTDFLTRKYISQVIFSGNYIDEKELLKKIFIPILITQGKQEQLSNIEYIKKVEIPSLWENKIHEIPDSGHLAQYENPDEFNHLLKVFLTDINY